MWVALSGDPEGDDGRAELFDRASATESRMYEWPHRARATKLFDAFTDPRPPGLATLAAHLFRDDAEPADDVTGLEVVEAPGVVGEVRMVARDIKRRLLAGASPESIVVAARDLETYAPLLRELFAEYGVPCRVSGPTPLAQQPWVGTLLRAVALPDDNFPFAATTALLRSGFIKPRWTQARDPATARLAEQLLRMLGETRDRTHYLRAVDAWATQPPAALEDEAGDEPRRAKIQRLAQRCGSFLHRYFACWDGLPERGTLATFGGWLAKFAQKLGLLNKDTAPEDRAAWMQLRQVFEEWAARERGWGRAGKVIPRPTFVRLLTSLATVKHHDDDPAGEAAVRCLPATDAAHLCADTVYVLGLGERGFPNLGSNETLLEEGERQQLRAGGLDLPTADGRLPGEMLLFHQLCTRALERLVLCYPAVDEKGQELLPSSFLLAVRACFAENAIPTTRQKMLIEGFDTAGPLGPAELRVRAAIEWERHADAPLLPRPLHDHLSAGRRAVASRFGERDWTAYDGRIAAPAMVRALQALVGPDKVFSPTALEDYIDCPFRFFLKHVLKLEPLADPADEVETTRRGQAFHRALTRLHQTRETCDSSAVSAALRDELARAVTEDAGRTSSLVARALWRHEGRRLDRAGGRYGDHWAEFLGGWLKANAALAPRHFELPFGMTTDVHGPLELSADGETVRIGGRIDRVDVVDLPNGGVGFYVIDYKTGSGVSYTATALNKLVKLQLPLYALAVERIVFPEGDARPLGMAYWMVTDTGAKPVLPAGKKAQQWLAALDEWPAYRDRLEAWIVRRVAAIRRGLFPLAPRERECTATCAFGHVCRISQARSRLKVWELAPGGTDDTAEP